MDPSVSVASNTPQDGGTPLGAGGVVDPTQQPQQSQQAQQPAAGGQGQGVGQQQQGTNIVIPSAAMKRIKEEERARGRSEALDALARESGFASNMELVSALAALRGQPPQQPQQPTPQPPPTQQAQIPQVPQPTPQHQDPLAQTNEQRAAGKYERKLEQLTRERDKYVHEAQTQTEAVRKLQEELDAKVAEVALREMAVGVGVKDVDYALRLFYREVEGKTEEELTKLDERAFFTGLRQTRPYLFGEAVVPANTGPGTGGAPPAPKPGTVSSQQARNGQFDARNAKPDDIAARLRQMGLNQHL